MLTPSSKYEESLLFFLLFLVIARSGRRGLAPLTRYLSSPAKTENVIKSPDTDAGVGGAAYDYIIVVLRYPKWTDFYFYCASRVTACRDLAVWPQHAVSHR